MREYSVDATIADPWSNAALAFFVRYPSPYALHVLTADVISREIDPTTQAVHTTRLLLKRGVVPRWVPRSIVANKTDSWVLETSVVDVQGRILQMTTRNLDHRYVLDVEEKQTWRANEHGTVSSHTSARISSNVGLGGSQGFFGFGMSVLRDRIEAFGLYKFQLNTERARRGIDLVLRTMADSTDARRRILSGRPYPYPHHALADGVAHWERDAGGALGHGFPAAEAERYEDKIPPALRKEPLPLPTTWWSLRYRRRQAEIDGFEPPPSPLMRLREAIGRFFWRSRPDTKD